MSKIDTKKKKKKKKKRGSRWDRIDRETLEQSGQKPKTKAFKR